MASLSIKKDSFILIIKILVGGVGRRGKEVDMFTGFQVLNPIGDLVIFILNIFSSQHMQKFKQCSVVSPGSGFSDS
jgi:hypothetical protein